MPRGRTPSSNRSDLDRPKAAPRMTAPGQAYGKQTAQKQSMKISPLTPPGANAPNPTPTPATPVQTTQTPDFGALLGGSRFPAGTLGDFSGPTQRPEVPVTNGLPTGPGAGPEALRGFAAAGADLLANQGTGRDLIRRLASQPNASSTLQQLAAGA